MNTWPHAPSKVVTHPGTYIITGSTYHKQHLFNTPKKLEFLHSTLLAVADDQRWQLQAWAVFSNHYHLVGFSPPVEESVRAFTKQLHGESSRRLNELDECAGRTVWFRSFDTRLTFEKSYLARLAYVHNNPVRHGMAKDPTNYRWCSARWFAENADRAFRETIQRIRWDSVSVYDDF